MNVAGQLDVLSPDQMQVVHEKACELLAKKGVVFESDAAIDVFKKHGFKVSDHVVYFEKAEIDRCVELAPSKFKLEAPNHEHDVVVGDDRILIHPNGGEVFVREYDGTRRQATRQDFAELQILYQALPNIDIGGYEPVSLNDVDKRMRGIVGMFESFKHCDKPLLSPMSLETIQKKEEVIRLYNIGFGIGCRICQRRFDVVSVRTAQAAFEQPVDLSFIEYVRSTIHVMQPCVHGHAGSEVAAAFRYEFFEWQPQTFEHAVIDVATCLVDHDDVVADAICCGKRHALRIEAFEDELGAVTVCEQDAGNLEAFDPSPQLGDIETGFGHLRVKKLQVVDEAPSWFFRHIPNSQKRVKRVAVHKRQRQLAC